MSELHDYAMNLLESCGCDLGAYRKDTVERVIEDLKIYEEDHEPLPYPYEDIAKELIEIGKSQPFYPEDGEETEGMCPGGDICHWGYDELYSDAEERLRKLIAEKNPFDTGWLGSKKEITSCRIQCDGIHLLCSVHCEIDDFPAIIDDYNIPDFDKSKMDEYEEIWTNGPYCEEYDESEEIEISTYESMIETLCRLYKEVSDVLEGWYKDYGLSIGAVFEAE